jgi:SAM-dependent methyltransferase
MNKEMPASFYTGQGYLQPGKFEAYKPLYDEVVSMLPDSKNCPMIIDLGCGVGFFARVVREANYKNYIGVDFSKQVLKHAKKNNPEFRFWEYDLYNIKLKKIFAKYRLFTMLETLEHIQDDKKVLSYIPKGATIIGSVPSSLSKSHVRAFQGIPDVVKRYEDIIKFNMMKELITEPKKHIITIFKGVKK